MKYCLILLSLLTVFSYAYSRNAIEYDTYALYFSNSFLDGYDYYKKSKYDSASAEFYNAVLHQPGNPKGIIWLARTYIRTGKFREAHDLLKKETQWGIFARVRLIEMEKAWRYYTNSDATMLASYSGYKTLKTIKTKGYQRQRFSNPTGVAVDKSGVVYICSFNLKYILKINANGDFMGKTGKFKRPFGVCIDGMERVIATDFKGDCVNIYDRRGKLVRTIGSHGRDEGSFIGPEGVVSDRNCNIYVVDSGNCRIQKFGYNGRFRMSFGIPGNGDGEFDRPSSIAISDRGELFVADYGNNRVQKFDCSGNFLKAYNFKNPRSIIKGKKGGFLVSCADGIYLINDAENTSLKIINTSVEHLKPVGLTETENGFMYLTDFKNSSIYILAPSLYADRIAGIDIELVRTEVENRMKVKNYLKVMTRDGRPVSGLTKDNFKVKQDSGDVYPVFVDYDRDVYNVSYTYDSRQERKETWHDVIIGVKFSDMQSESVTGYYAE